MTELIIAGIPRSGTTMMWYASQGMKPTSHMPRNYNPSTALVLKTHATPSKLGLPLRQLPQMRAIFMFGDPIMSVISTRLRRWDNKHFWNCGCTLSPREADIYGKDILGYERMFDGWMKPQPFPLLTLRYETVHDNLAIIRKFLDHPSFHLPLRHERKTKLTDIRPDQLQSAAQTYASLARKIKQAQDAVVWSPNKDKSQ